MSEPSLEILGGAGTSRVVRRLLLATRPAFLTASVLPVLLGTAWGYQQSGMLELNAFLLALVAVICAHAATNVLNDVYDDVSGADIGNDDRLHPFTGGSRFIQNGILTRGEMARWGTLLAGISVVLGLVLVVLKGFPIIVFGIAGLALGVLYSAPPVQLNSRGTGEIAVGMGLGILPVCGAAWLQSGTVAPATILLSLPVAAWVMNILVINEVPDAGADARAGKRTLVVRMGVNGTHFLYLGLNGLAALVVLLMVLAGNLAIPALLLPLVVAVGSPFAARGISSEINRDQLVTGIKLTLGAHAAGILWLLGWVLAG